MTEAFPTLFSPIKLGPLTLRNRIAMAPLTRQMAEPDGTPTDEMVAYYARRARGGLGLIITEGTYEQDAFQSVDLLCKRLAHFQVFGKRQLLYFSSIGMYLQLFRCFGTGSNDH